MGGEFGENAYIYMCGWVLLLATWNYHIAIQLHSNTKWKGKKKKKNNHHQKNLQTINAGEGEEKRELSYTTGGNVNGYNHDGEEYSGSLKICIQNYHMSQKSHSKA